MKIKNFFTKLLRAAAASMRRFPVVLIYCAIAAVIAILITHLNLYEDTLARILAAVMLSAASAFTINMVFERLKYKDWKYHIVSAIVSAVFAVIYYIFLLSNFDSPVTGLRYAFITGAITIAGLIAHYFPKREGIGLYSTRILVRALTTFLYSLVIIAGISAVLFAIDRLLEIHIEGELYTDFIILTGFIFAPAFFLGGYPDYDRQSKREDMPSLLKVLLFYIVMPLCTVYATILYIYFFKVLITWEWPSGLVAHLVIWFSVIVLIVFYFTEPVSEERKWPYLFNKVAPFLMLPLIAMMFVSLGIRINAYGVTVNRYIVLAGGIWVLACMLYRCIIQLLKKPAKDIFMPLSLAVILILSVIGPWSAFSVTFANQKARLDNILERYGILYNGSINKKPDVAISSDDAVDVTSIISYFKRFDMIKKVSYLPSDFKVDDMEDYLGIKPRYYWEENERLQRYLSYNSQASIVDVKGYDYVIYGTYYNRKTENDKTEKYGLFIINENDIVNIYKDSEILGSVDLRKVMNKFYEIYGDQPKLSDDGYVNGELTWEESFEKADIKMVFRYISGFIKLDGDNDNRIDTEHIGAEYIVLIKLK